MDDKKLDRRIVRTRRMLRDALIQLILERGYDGLTITEITDRADLRRATFYLHYADVDELLLTSLREIFDELVLELQAKQSPEPFYIAMQPPHSLVMFEYVAENAQLYTALLTSSAGVKVQRYIRDYLAQIKLHDLAQLETGTIPHDFIAHYVAGMECAMMVWWLENNLIYSAYEMADLTQKMLLEGLGQFVKIGA